MSFWCPSESDMTDYKFSAWGHVFNLKPLKWECDFLKLVSVESLVQKNRLFNQTWSLFRFCSISDPGCLTQRSHNLTQPVEVHWTWDTLGHEFRGLSPCLQHQQTLKHLSVESGSAEVNAGRVSVLLKSFSERKTRAGNFRDFTQQLNKKRNCVERV